MTAPCLRFERDVVLMLVLVSACGARSSARALQNPVADGAGGVGGQREDAGTQGQDAAAASGGPGQPDATSVDAMDSMDGAVGVTDGGPTCAEVGKHTGISACCSGSYCAGGCVGKQPYCVCGAIVGGCPWPLVCCAAKGGGCWAEEWCPQ